MKKVLVKESRIEGTGVYAVRDFKKGEIVITWKADRIMKKEAIKNLSKDNQNHLCYIGKGQYIVQQSPERYVNHSCDPNTYVKNKRDIAKRDIKKGEEITTDYSLDSMEDWEMTCECGSKNCRKTIYGDFRKLDEKSKKKLEPFLEEWFKKELNK